MKEYIIADDFLDDLTMKFASAQGQLKELIRCKDCKYFKGRSVYHHGLCDIHCNGIGYCEVTSEDQYCSWAERKEK